MKYKIIYDRKNCIGVGSCAILADKFWKMNKEGDKADLLGAKKIAQKKGRKEGDDNDEGDIWELEIKETELQDNKEAARNCPVNVIKISVLRNPGVQERAKAH